LILSSLLKFTLLIKSGDTLIVSYLLGKSVNEMVDLYRNDEK
jgi:hypothetical protein